MNFLAWKKECKRIIYEQTENVDSEGLAEHNIECVNEWKYQYEEGKTPLQAVKEANEDAREHFLDNQ